MSDLSQVAYEMAAKDLLWKASPTLMAYSDTGEIVYVNPLAAEMFGYGVDELLGQQVEVLMSEHLRAMHTKWRQDIALPKHRLLSLATQMSGRKKDGTMFPVHVGLLELSSMGRSIGLAVVTDLTGVIVGEHAKLGMPSDSALLPRGLLSLAETPPA